MSWRRSGHKYNAKRVKIDGYTFDSKAEARRYGELRLLAKAGEIESLKIHPVFPIPGTAFEGISFICKVILDFEYWDKKAARYKYEDVKGVETTVSRLKRKLLKAFYGIDVEVIR